MDSNNFHAHIIESFISSTQTQLLELFKHGKKFRVESFTKLWTFQNMWCRVGNPIVRGEIQSLKLLRKKKYKYILIIYRNI